MQSPYMNTAEISEYLRFVNRDGSLNLRAAQDWITKEQIRAKREGREFLVKRRGRSLLVHKDSVEGALTVRSLAS